MSLAADTHVQLQAVQGAAQPARRGGRVLDPIERNVGTHPVLPQGLGAGETHAPPVADTRAKRSRHGAKSWLNKAQTPCGAAHT